MNKRNTSWHKALEIDELPEGRVKSVTIGLTSICMTHYKGKYGALDNHCPHQGGPLGEGSIENGYLRCPWHGWDYCPLTGTPPGGEFDDAVRKYSVEVRDDGVYVEVPEDLPHNMNISDLIVETLANWGVKWCFGMVGHSNLNVAEAIRIHEESNSIRFIGIRHEGAASFACSAYGKLTGRPASCLAIAGPGSTNLLTGLWDANVDRAPVIALTGQVSTQVLGTGNFQEVDLKAAFGKVAQWSQVVLPNSNHSELGNLACKSAILNRGVSQLIFPDEVAGLSVDVGEPGTPINRIPKLTIAPPEDALNEALELIKGSERPVIIVGHGARFDIPAVLELAEELNAPVLTTFKGKGLISDEHRLGCGVLGRSGTPVASWFMNESSCLIVFGASFSNHTGITPKKPTIQIDSEATALAKFHPVEVPILGDVGVTAKLLLNSLNGNHKSFDQAAEVAARKEIWKNEKRKRESDDRGLGLNSASIFSALTRQVEEDAIICVDVGNNTYSFGRYFECSKQAVLMSGYLGSIGFAYPASLGAWAATQEKDSQFFGRQVVSVSGDGGFGQYPFEINTAVKYGMNVTHILLRNDNLGKISKEQRAGNWSVWQTDLHNPNFSEYAKLCGAFGVRVTKKEKLDEALRWALDHNGPSLVEIISDEELI